MPKLFGKNIPPLALYVGAPVLAYFIYDGLFPAAPASSAKSRVTARSRTSTTTKTNSLFTEEDYEAKFASFKKAPRDAFRPLVEKKNTNARTAAALGAGVLPGDLTGGEANWVYTGYASLNGVRQGLLENSSSGESVFLVVWQRWRALTVQTIGAEEMIVTGPTGTAVTIPIGDTATEQTPTPGVVAPNGGTAPLNPAGALAGPIGGVPGGPNPVDLRVEPDASQTQNAQRGPGGRRRRRGN